MAPKPLSGARLLIAVALVLLGAVRQGDADSADATGAVPPAKKISAKTARTLLKEIHDALTTEEANAEIAAARPSSEGAALDDAARQAMMQAVMPVLERFAGKVLQRHGFKNIPEALRSATEVARRKFDREVQRSMEAIGEVISGEKKVGRVPELTALAEKFVDMEEQERSSAMDRAEQVLEGLTVDGNVTVPGAEIYLEVMKGVMDGGIEYVEESILKLVAAISNMKGPNGQPPAEDPKALSRRVNVLMEFLRASDFKRIQKRINAIRKGGSAGHAPPKSDEL